MKKTVYILLSFLTVLLGFMVVIGKTVSASAENAATEEIAFEDIYMDAQADTLGGSTGGAPETNSYEQLIFDFIDESDSDAEREDQTTLFDEEEGFLLP